MTAVLGYYAFTPIALGKCGPSEAVISSSPAHKCLNCLKCTKMPKIFDPVFMIEGLVAG